MKRNEFMIIFLFCLSFFSVKMNGQNTEMPLDTTTQKSYQLLISVPAEIYKSVSEKIEKFNLENEQEYLRVGDLRMQNNAAYIFVRKFKNLNECKYYLSNLRQSELFNAFEMVPISLNNFRIFLGKKTTFDAYKLFYEKELAN